MNQLNTLSIPARNTTATFLTAVMLAVAGNQDMVYGAAPEPHAVAHEKPEADKQPETTKTRKARLFLTNGDKLRGLPRSTDENRHLLFHSDSLKQSANFPLTSLLSISFDSWSQPPRIKTVTRIRLHPRFHESIGDVIEGELKELTEDTIKLDTWYGGPISLKRSMVKSLNIISNAPGNYRGPNNIKEWKQSDASNPWYFDRGTLVCETSGGLGIDVGLLEKSHIGFDASWDKGMRFKLQFYSNDIDKVYPSACYELNINRYYASIRTAGTSRQGARRIMQAARQKQLTNRPKGNQARMDIYTNRKNGTISIYFNGLHACTLQSQNPDPKNLGTGIAFIAEKNYSIKISDITVSPWNGTSLPKAAKNHKAPDNNKDADPNTTEQPPHRIVLNNGDEVPGTVGIVDQGRIVIETEYTPIRIPLDKINGLNLGSSKEAPKKYREDVRAWFHSGGFITLKLTSMDQDKIRGFNQATGDVSLDLAAFGRIDFNIYNRDANETREDTRF